MSAAEKITPLGSEETEPFTFEEVQAAKDKNPGVELRIIGADGEAVICKAPTRGEYRRFRSMYLDGAQRAMATETLLIGCVVHPDRGELGRLLERRPGLAETFGEKLIAWAGLGVEAYEKKL